MNIATVLAAAEKQWIDGVPLTVLQVGESKQGKYGFEQTITVRDAMQQQRTMKIQTKYETGLMSPMEVNQTMNFRLKWFTAQAGPGLAGYCEQPLNHGGAAPAAAPAAGYVPPTAPPAPSYTPPPQTPQPDIQDRICFAQAVNLGISLYTTEKCLKGDVKQCIESFYGLLTTRNFPAWMSGTPETTGGVTPDQQTTYDNAGNAEAQEPTPW